MARRLKNFRLSEEACVVLAEIAGAQHLSEARIVERLILGRPAAREGAHLVPASKRGAQGSAAVAKERLMKDALDKNPQWTPEQLAEIKRQDALNKKAAHQTDQITTRSRDSKITRTIPDPKDRGLV